MLHMINVHIPNPLNFLPCKFSPNWQAQLGKTVESIKKQCIDPTCTLFLLLRIN